jgi:hypothetical protein
MNSWPFSVHKLRGPVVPEWLRHTGANNKQVHAETSEKPGHDTWPNPV